MNNEYMKCYAVKNMGTLVTAVHFVPLFRSASQCQWMGSDMHFCHPYSSYIHFILRNFCFGLLLVQQYSSESIMPQPRERLVTSPPRVKTTLNIASSLPTPQIGLFTRSATTQHRERKNVKVDFGLSFAGLMPIYGARGRRRLSAANINIYVYASSSDHVAGHGSCLDSGQAR